MSFSRAQQAKYRPVVDKAWLNNCEHTGQAPNNKSAKNDWYRQQLLDATGAYSTKELNKTDDFDKAILHFAIIANDEYWMTRGSAGAERRLKYIIRGFLRDLSWLNKEKHDWKYVCGIYKQSKLLPSKMDDAPAWQLYKVMQMLDSQIQRICRDYGIKRKEIPALRKRGANLDINPDAKHFHIGHDLDRFHTAAKQPELPF